jgi:putative ABC transport system ATP-binding protein
MIEICNVTKKFGNRTIIDNLSMRFIENRFYAIVGRSGAGKSTLLNMLARLERPTAGQVQFDGRDVWRMKERDYFREYLGYIFQNYALVENATVRYNLRMVSKNTENQLNALAQVGLDESVLGEKVFRLSGGQAQRVGIARTFLKRPKLVLADEPTGALDALTGQQIIDILKNQVSPNTTVIVATHDPAVFQVADEIVDLGHCKSNRDFGLGRVAML